MGRGDGAVRGGEGERVKAWKWLYGRERLSVRGMGEREEALYGEVRGNWT